MDIEFFLKLMAEKNASDMFLTSGAPVNIKVEGDLIALGDAPLPAGMAKKVAYSLMNEGQITEFERELELNMAIAVPNSGRFRVNVFQQRGEVGMVIRAIRSDIPSIEELQLPQVLKDIIMAPRGLVLIVGSTGSGKSTTLASMIDHRNTTSTGHILTIEDPIEYLHRHKKSIVNQREVGLDTHSFHAALKNAMREAPDVILIGEIRDAQTMEAAIAFAETGHLCLATLHANNSYHALNRIISFFPLENRPALFLDLSVALRAIVSQRLVKKPDGKRLPTCEIMLNTRHISELIERGEVQGIKDAMEQTLAPGSQTFEQDLFKLYHEGTITLDEALANADSPTNLSWLINNSEFNTNNGKEEKKPDISLEFDSTNEGGASFKEFQLSLADDEDPRQ